MNNPQAPDVFTDDERWNIKEHFQHSPPQSDGSRLVLRLIKEIDDLRYELEHASHRVRWLLDQEEKAGQVDWRSEAIIIGGRIDTTLAQRGYEPDREPDPNA